MHGIRFQGVAPSAVLSIALMFVIGALAGCERAGQNGDVAEGQEQVDHPGGDAQPLGQVTEFEGFTLRANLIRTEFLPDAMARQYGIEADPDLVLLNLVVLEKLPDRQPVAVSAEVSAHYESLVGHPETIDMRAVEADGHVSYIGTLDVSTQRVFRFVIDAQPAGTDKPLRMNFEAQLHTLDVE
jgi:hypothetical protein